MLRLLLLFYSLVAVLANTETHIIQIPNHFNIPNHPDPFQLVDIISLNHSHSIIYDYPITTMYNYDSPVDTIELKSPLQDQQGQIILIKLNNYENSTYNSNDLLFIKLCWPAIYPMDISLDHRFISSHTLNDDMNSLDIYLVVNYKADFKAIDPGYVLEGWKFKLVVEKLANQWIPIPLEVYDIVVYIVDILIVIYRVIDLMRWGGVIP